MTELVTEAHLYFPKDQQGKRSVADIKKYDPAKPEFWVSDAAKQEYEIVPLVSRPQAAKIIAAKDKEIDKLKRNLEAREAQIIFLEHRWKEGKAAEAKLAQYEAQEPVAWFAKSLYSEKIIYNVYQVNKRFRPLYASPAPTK